MTYKLPVYRALALAESMAGANASARLCLEDATALYNKGEFVHARQRALKSLEYSVGVFHADYQRAGEVAL